MEVEDPRLGTVLQGRYRIVERLAAGGMGVVYRGQRVHLERSVAIKFLHANVAAASKAMKRFEREARIMGRLAHPHCVSVIDVGVDQSPFIVMDYVSGRDLKRILADEGPMPVRRALHILRQVLAGLAHAHALGIVHRDIKPANIMITDAEGTRDHVYVLDFGLAKFRQSTEDLTGSAALIGTPSFMSPEQARGEKAGMPADIYAAGLVLLVMLTGRNPFKAKNPLDTLLNHQRLTVPTLKELLPAGDHPPEIDALLAKAMAKEPGERFESALAFIDAVDAMLDGAESATESATGAAAAHDAARDGNGDADADADSDAGVAALDAVSVPDSSIVGPPQRSALLPLMLVTLPVLSALATWYLMRDHLPTTVTQIQFDAGVAGDADQSGDAGIGRDAAVVVIVPPIDAAARPADAASSDAVATGLADAGPTDAAGTTVDAGRAVPAAPIDAAVPARPGADAGVRLTALKPEDSPVKTIHEVVKLIQKGRRDEAIAGILKLRPTHRRSAYLPFLLGNLCFEKKLFNAGLDAYRDAVVTNAVYGRKAEVNNNVILALSDPGSRAKAVRLIVDVIGEDAVPYLRKAAKSHGDAAVRKLAGELVEKLRQRKSQ